MKYVLLADGIDAEQLMAEIATLEKTAYARQIKTPEEKSLAARSRQAWLTGKLVDFALTPLEWEEYDAGPRPVAREALISFENFYKEARSRDIAMAKNLLHAMKVDSLPTKAKEVPVILLVTGGFHAEGMTQQLTQQGATVISYVPKIEKVDTAQGSTYLSVFTQEKSPLEKLFAGNKLFLAQVPLKPVDRQTILPLAVIAAAVFLGYVLLNADVNGIYHSFDGLGVLRDISLKEGIFHATITLSAGTAIVWVFGNLSKKKIVKVGITNGGSSFKRFLKRCFAKLNSVVNKKAYSTNNEQSDANRDVRFFWVAGITFLVDQLSKWTVLALAPAGFVDEVTQHKRFLQGLFFSNEGDNVVVGPVLASLGDYWGIRLSQHSVGNLLPVLMVMVGAVLLVWNHRSSISPNSRKSTGLAMMMGGALGNLFDFLVWGDVWDWFSNANLQTNLADISAIVGVLLYFSGIWQKSTTNREKKFNPFVSAVALSLVFHSLVLSPKNFLEKAQQIPNFLQSLLPHQKFEVPRPTGTVNEFFSGPFRAVHSNDNGKFFIELSFQYRSGYLILGKEYLTVDGSKAEFKFEPLVPQKESPHYRFHREEWERKFSTEKVALAAKILIELSESLPHMLEQSDSATQFLHSLGHGAPYTWNDSRNYSLQKNLSLLELMIQKIPVGIDTPTVISSQGQRNKKSPAPLRLTWTMGPPPPFIVDPFPSLKEPSAERPVLWIPSQMGLSRSHFLQARKELLAYVQRLRDTLESVDSSQVRDPLGNLKRFSNPEEDMLALGLPNTRDSREFYRWEFLPKIVIERDHELILTISSADPGVNVGGIEVMLENMETRIPIKIRRTVILSPGIHSIRLPLPAGLIRQIIIFPSKSTSVKKVNLKPLNSSSPSTLSQVWSQFSDNGPLDHILRLAKWESAPSRVAMGLAVGAHFLLGASLGWAFGAAILAGALGAAHWFGTYAVAGGKLQEVRRQNSLGKALSWFLWTSAFGVSLYLLGSVLPQDLVAFGLFLSTWIGTYLGVKGHGLSNRKWVADNLHSLTEPEQAMARNILKNLFGRPSRFIISLSQFIEFLSSLRRGIVDGWGRIFRFKMKTLILIISLVSQSLTVPYVIAQEENVDLDTSSSSIVDLFKGHEYLIRALLLGISPENKNEFELIRLPEAQEFMENNMSGENLPIPVAIIDLSNGEVMPTVLTKNMALNNHGSSMADIVHQVAGDRADVWTLSAGFKSEAGVYNMAGIGKAVRYAVREGARVIMISLSGDGSNEAREAIKEALDKGVIVVMAVGNDGLEDTAILPIYDERILMVGSVLGNGKRAPESNFGKTIEGIKVVDIFAPGRLIVTLPNGKKDLATGTSFTPPVVGGLAVLLFSINKNLSGAEVTSIIKGTASKKGQGLPVVDFFSGGKKDYSHEREQRWEIFALHLGMVLAVDAGLGSLA